VKDGVTGFHIRQLTLDGVLENVRRAFGVFARRPVLNKMRRNAMAQTFSWRESAQDYGSLYLRSIGNR
jgi:glycogen synthase